MGRKTKLTDEIIQKICTVVAEGNYYKTAALSVGISEATFYNWKKRGEEVKSGKYLEFLELLKKAEAKSEAKYLGVIKDAANDGTWQASAWWLERRYPDRWGKKDKHELTGKDGQPLERVIIIKNKDDS